MEYYIKVLVAEAELSDDQNELMDIFEKMFGSNACSSIPKYNNFTNFISYFIQKVSVDVLFLSWANNFSNLFLLRKQYSTSSSCPHLKTTPVAKIAEKSSL